MKLNTLAVAALATALCATPAIAWGPEGHTLIARVASQRLTGQAKADWDWLVKVGIPALNATTKGQCQIDPQNPLGPIVNPMDNSKSNLANWPDCDREIDRTTAAWHFEDIPIGQAPSALPTPDPWCATGCASQALAANLKTLATAPASTANAADTARALVFVVHLLGDIHQPLHTSNNGDHGGNQVKVSTAGSGISATEFHGLWDTPLVANAYGRDLDAAAAALAKDTAQGDPHWTDGTASQAAINTSIRTWIADSHIDGIAAYKGLAPPPSGAGGYSAKVNAAYVAKETPVVAGQLQRASVRLAAVLQTTLTWKPPAH